MATQGIKPRDMRLQGGQAPCHGCQPRLRLNAHLGERLGAINRLLLLRRDSGCLLGVQPLSKADVVADGDQPNRQPNKQGRKQRPRPPPQFKGARSRMAIE